MISAVSVLALILVANGAPVLGHVLLRDRLGWPLDCGLRLPDGRALLGPGKTVRGLVLSLGATVACAWLAGLPAAMGALVSGTAMLGDVTSSFLKRRLGREPGSQVLGLDQIPESLLPLLAVRGRVGLGMAEIVGVLLAFMLVELVLTRLVSPPASRNHPS